MASIIDILNYSGDGKNIAPYSLEYAEGHQEEVVDNKYGAGTFNNIWSGIWGEQGAAAGISNIFSSIFGGVAAMKYAQNTTTQNVNTTTNNSNIGTYIALGGVALVALVIVIVLVTGRRNR